MVQKYIFCHLVFLLIITSVVHAQDSTQGFHFSLGTPTTGIGIGDLRQYSGIRLNTDDSAVVEINGISASIFRRSDWHSGDPESYCNGAALSLIGHQYSHVNGISVSIGVDESIHVNGISFGCFGNSGDTRIGFCWGGLGVFARQVNGVVGSLMMTNVDTVNGLACSAFAVGGTMSATINGISISGVLQRLETNRGLAIAPLNTSSRTFGVQIGAVNVTRELYGIQIGLMNYAANSVIPWLPGVNVGWKKAN